MAIRACSMPVAASAGGPTTSPAAKICGTSVRHCASTCDQAALAGREAGGGEIEIVGVALPSRGDQHIGHRESRAGGKA